MPKQPHSDTIIAGDQNPNSQHQLPDSEHPSVDRRMFLAGAAASTTGLLSMPASAQELPNADLAAALARFRASIPAISTGPMSRTRSSRSSSPASTKASGRHCR